DYPRTLAELESRFSSEQACREYLFRLRWPEGFRCSRCDDAKAWPLRSGLWQCSRCGYQIDGDVFVGGVDTHMPQPMGDRAEIDPRTQQVKGRTVANRVRVKSLALQRRPPQCRFLHVLIQDEADTEPGQPGAPIIKEHRSRLARREVDRK